MSPRIPIRVKLALALAVPLVAVVVMATLQVQAARDDTRAARDDADLALGVIGPGSVIRAAQNEQLDAITTTVGLRESAPVETDSMEASREAVDAAIAELRTGLDDGSVAGAAIYGPVLDQVEGLLATARARFDTVELPYSLDRISDARAVTNLYEPVIQQLASANGQLLNQIDDRSLQEPVAVLNQVVRSKSEYTSMGQWAIFAEITGSADGGPERDLVVASRSRVGDTVRVLRTYAGPSEFGRIVDEIASNPDTEEMRTMVDGQLAGDPFDVQVFLDAATRADTSSGADARSNTEAYLRETASGLVADAEAREQRYLVAAALVALGALLAALLAARSITKPMLSLTRQARDMAQTKLPFAVQQVRDTPLGADVVIPKVAPVEVRSRDEVQDVVAALNRVQTSALDLAVEQAVMRHHIADTFVNLGRRTQNLISRQLDVITELERDETDPKALEQLFGLDHLATRARRNAESLVVLAGVETPRTFQAPVAIRDVMLGCRSEVEGYERVKVVVIDDIGVPGAIAADLVHLLAELVENGLAFSPPDRSVEVVGRLTPRGYVIGVVDQGVGMTEEELVRANARLSRTEDFTIAPSRYLGHYVVGQLAERLGAEVDLQDAFTGGVAARVVIPVERLVSLSEETALPSPDDEIIVLDDPVPDPTPEAAPASMPSTSFDPSELKGIVVEGRPPRRMPVTNGTSQAVAEPEVVALPDAVRASTTPNGLTRRVPGSQRTKGPTPLSRGPVFPIEKPATDEARATEAASLLTNFVAGVQRGREDALAVADPIGVALASVTAINADRAAGRPGGPGRNGATGATGTSGGGADAGADHDGRSDDHGSNR